MIRQAESAGVGEIAYPTSDGKPMAETDTHRLLMIGLTETLDWYFRIDPMVYVSGNLLVYYEQGNPRRHISPDVFVVRGVEKRIRSNYKLWEEGRGLDVVIEISSKTTAKDDRGKKRNLYLSKLGVQEYFLFDPLEEYLHPSLQGYRRIDDEFRDIAAVDGRLPSQLLGLHLERDGDQLRLWDPKTGKRILIFSEREEMAQKVAKEAQEQVIEAQTQAKKAQEQVIEAQTQAKKAQEQVIEAQTQAKKAQERTLNLEAEIKRLMELIRGSSGQ